MYIVRPCFLLCLDKYVISFDISMYNIMKIQIFHPLDNLTHNVSGFILVKSSCRLLVLPHKRLEVALIAVVGE
jgi:hypothetical protein